MVQIFSLAALASAALSAAALELDFVRYSRENCVDNYHIRKDVNLHDPHCKTFSDNEPPFSSFKISLDDDKDDLYKKQCYVTVYAGKDCTGASMKYTRESLILPFFHLLLTHFTVLARSPCSLLLHRPSTITFPLLLHPRLPSLTRLANLTDVP